MEQENNNKNNNNNTQQPPQKKSNQTVFMIFSVFLGLFILKVPKYLAEYGQYIAEHKEMWYGYLAICAVILVALKLFYVKNHNWDTYLTIVMLGLIIATLIYNFANIPKHFEGELRSQAYYLWLSASVIPIIGFILIDKTDYSEMIEFEKKINENEDKMAERRHKRYLKRREKNPCFWHKSKKNKIICDTIVYIAVILIICLIIFVLINYYNNFQERVKMMEDSGRDYHQSRFNQYRSYNSYTSYDKNNNNKHQYNQYTDDDVDDENDEYYQEL